MHIAQQKRRELKETESKTLKVRRSEREMRKIRCAENRIRIADECVMLKHSENMSFETK